MATCAPLSLCPAPLQTLPPGDDEVISFSFVRSCFLNLARLF